jgi:hypothetical protein
MRAFRSAHIDIIGSDQPKPLIRILPKSGMGT